MIIKNANLEKIAVDSSQYPELPIPEIAFAGRSNVGKSSFINSMVKKKGLARTSSKPGKTRTINFYNINGEFRFVDLPGYGYAKVSKEERKKWGIIIEEYLTSRENLKEVILVIDIRHKPSKDDIQMYNWIKHFGYGSFIVATKSDKISRNKININIREIQKTLGIESIGSIIPYTSEKSMDRKKIWSKIKKII